MMLDRRFSTKQTKNRRCILKVMRLSTIIRLLVWAAVLIAERGCERSEKDTWLHKSPPAKSTSKRVSNLVKNLRTWRHCVPPKVTKNPLARTKILNKLKSDKKVKTNRRVKVYMVRLQSCHNIQILKQI